MLTFVGSSPREISGTTHGRNADASETPALKSVVLTNPQTSATRSRTRPGCIEGILPKRAGVRPSSGAAMFGHQNT